MKREIIIFIIIFILGLSLRFYDLERRPVHYDEGGGYAIGIRDLAKTGNYHYNPDFHGPFLFYIGALSFKLFLSSPFTTNIPFFGRCSTNFPNALIILFKFL